MTYLLCCFAALSEYFFLASRASPSVFFSFFFSLLDFWYAPSASSSTNRASSRKAIRWNLKHGIQWTAYIVAVAAVQQASAVTSAACLYVAQIVTMSYHTSNLNEHQVAITCILVSFWLLPKLCWFPVQACSK